MADVVRQSIPSAQIATFACDVKEEREISACCDQIRRFFPATNIEVFVYNVAHKPSKQSVLELDVSKDFDLSWRVNCLGALLFTRQIVQSMKDARQGTIIFSGCTNSITGLAKESAYCSSKFALRGLNQSVAREFGPYGIHTIHVVIDGTIVSESDYSSGVNSGLAVLNANHIADIYFQLHKQPVTSWTMELDLKPSVVK